MKKKIIIIALCVVLCGVGIFLFAKTREPVSPVEQDKENHQLADRTIRKPVDLDAEYPVYLTVDGGMITIEIYPAMQGWMVSSYNENVFEVTPEVFEDNISRHILYAKEAFSSESVTLFNGNIPASINVTIVSDNGTVGISEAKEYNIDDFTEQLTQDSDNELKQLFAEAGLINEDGAVENQTHYKEIFNEFGVDLKLPAGSIAWNAYNYSADADGNTTLQGDDSVAVEFEYKGWACLLSYNKSDVECTRDFIKGLESEFAEEYTPEQYRAAETRSGVYCLGVYDDETDCTWIVWETNTKKMPTLMIPGNPDPEIVSEILNNML